MKTRGRWQIRTSFSSRHHRRIYNQSSACSILSAEEEKFLGMTGIGWDIKYSVFYIPVLSSLLIGRQKDRRGRPRGTNAPYRTLYSTSSANVDIHSVSRGEALLGHKTAPSPSGLSDDSRHHAPPRVDRHPSVECLRSTCARRNGVVPRYSQLKFQREGSPRISEGTTN